MLIGSSVWSVEQDSQWYCDIKQKLFVSHRVQSWVVIANDQTKPGNLLCFGQWLSAGRTVSTVRSFAAHELHQSHAAAETVRQREDRE